MATRTGLVVSGVGRSDLMAELAESLKRTNKKEGHGAGRARD